MALNFEPTYTLNLTQEQIDRAKPGCEECVLAQLFKDEFPGYEIAVGAYRVAISKGRENGYLYHLDKVGTRIVHMFDTNNKEFIKPCPIRIDRGPRMFS